MDIQDVIIQKIDLPDFIQEYAHIELHRAGNEWRGTCPIHDGAKNEGSFSVSETGKYYCFSCNSGGNVINFVSDYDHISYSAAIEKLASMLNINLMSDENYRSQKEIEDKLVSYKERGKKNIEDIRQYLTEKRGLTNETIEKFELGYVDGRLTIPLLDANGRTVGMAVRQFDVKPKYRNSKNNLIYDKSAFLYGLDKARRLVKDEIYVVEGYFDAMSGYQMGVPTVAYCSSELHKDQIRTLNEYLQKGTNIVICPDNDEAGQKRLPRVRDYLKRIAPERQARVVIVPDGVKDLNDMLLAGIKVQDLETEHIDKFVLRLLLKRCKTVEEEYQVVEGYLKTVRSGLIRLDILRFLALRWDKDVEDLKKYFHTVGADSVDILNEVSDINGAITDLKKIYAAGGYKTHFQQIDTCIHKVEKKQVIVIGAYSGVGKSDFMIEYALRMICQERMRIAIFSLEMPKGKLIERCCAKLIGCPLSEVEGYIRSDDTRLQEAISKLQNHLIIFDGNNYSIDDIEKRISLVNAKGLLGGPLDMVFVDYFGYMSGVSNFEGACKSATRMKGIAKEYDLIFVMLSQLNRGGNPYGEPNMQQLKLTGDLEASADIVMLLWRPGKNPELSLEEKQQLAYTTRLKIDKARDGMYGPNVVEFTYNKNTSKLVENTHL